MLWRGLADRRLAAGDQLQILGGVVDRALFKRGAHAHVDHNFFQLRDLVDVRVLVLFPQRGHDFFLVFFVKSGFHFCSSRIWP